MEQIKMKNLDALRDEFILKENNFGGGYAGPNIDHLQKRAWNAALEAAGNMAGEFTLGDVVGKAVNDYPYAIIAFREGAKYQYEKQKAREGILIGLLEECLTDLKLWNEIENLKSGVTENLINKLSALQR